jgi:GntR family transcriptional repressor for pyruvate dehydrogenase complex
MITEDNFAPGSKFYSENELTRKLHVSRSSVREAVRILEATGYVTVQHGKGIFIADREERDADPFSGWLRNNESSIFEHFEVRLLIDPAAARYAAKNADENDIRKLEEVCADFQRKADDENRAGLIKCDEEFHTLLSKSTRNRTLYMVMKTMAKSLPEGWITSLHIPGRVEKTIIEHRNILEAIKNKDVEGAEKAMKEHLNNALEDIRKSMQDSQ